MTEKTLLPSPHTKTSASSRAGAMHSFDVALEHLRSHGGPLLALYGLAMTPFSIAMLLLADAVTSQHRSSVAPACFLLTLAHPWRWVGLGAVQRRVQCDLRGEPPLPLSHRWLGILFLRLYSCFALLWGSSLIFPAFYAFFLSAFAAPLLLEREGTAYGLARESLRWIHRAAGRLGRLLTGFSIITLVVVAGVAILQLFLVMTLLPNLLGLETADLQITLGSFAWLFGLAYLLFLAFDFFWTVASVMLYYDLEASRQGTDLRWRLRQLAGPISPGPGGEVSSERVRSGTEPSGT